MRFNLKYEIKRLVATIGYDPDNRRQIEVNLIEYGNGAKRFDIRKWWKEEHKMSKGISLTYEQARALRDAINQCKELVK